jgi:hypothetical protein
VLVVADPVAERFQPGFNVFLFRCATHRRKL